MRTADAQQPGGHERQRRAGEAQQHTHAGFRAQLARRQQRGAEKQPDTETDRGGEPHHDQLPPADPLRQVQAGGERDAGRDENAERLADDDRDRHAPRARLQRVKRHARVDQPEEEQRHLGGISPPDLELTQRIPRRRAGVDEESGIARGVRQERHDRHQGERRMEAAPEERVPGDAAGREQIGPEAPDACPPQPKASAIATAMISAPPAR